MTFELAYLFGAAVAYLLLLFLIAYAAERGWIPAQVARHPVTYVLSLGVYASSWTYYGSVGFAQSQGYNFLTIYLGVTLAFLLAPVLMMPVLRLVREYQLTSLADLFAFRYRSQLAGVLVTLFMLGGTLPYLALQIRAVVESVSILSQEATPTVLALGFCLTLMLFAILFGARHVTPREKHQGLVVAIAFESVVKLVALLTVGLFAVFGVFGGPGGMETWLAERPEALEALYRPVHEGPWGTLLLLSFAAAFLLPRQFHMLFAENLEPRALGLASWGFPLFLLLLNLAIPPILWAGMASASQTGADYYVLGITLDSGSTLLPLFAFIGGISAASAMMIVTTLALASMCLNHLLLPASYPDPTMDLYRWVLWARRVTIAIIILAGYGFYRLLEHNQGLVQLGLVSFVAVAQFLPGVVGLLYWARATRSGFIAGLLGGGTVWVLTLLAPLLQQSGLMEQAVDLDPWLRFMGQDKWTFATFWSLAVNGGLFVVVSLLTRPSSDEMEAAYACCRDTVAPPLGVVSAASPQEFEQLLTKVLGPHTAAKEVYQALRDLRMDPAERRPTELRRLRERIERNLSGLIGPQLARVIVDKRLSLDSTARTALADSMRFMEERLEASRSRLRGLAAELDSLRRYHRQVLQDLPVGACALGPDREIVIWNLAMETISGVDRLSAAGIPVDHLPSPWAGLIGGFLSTGDNHLHKVQVHVGNRTRWFNLHKATIEDMTQPAGAMSRPGGGTVVLVEDLTELQTLEAELAHSERLASIGRLAAGVAHEIGNPVTGIACLAQNIQAEGDETSLKDGIAQILQQTRRISTIVQSLVSFSHSGTVSDHSPELLDLRESIEDAVSLVRLSQQGKQLTFVDDCPPRLVVRGDRQRLSQVFVNLLTNACDASRPEDRVEIRAKESGGLIRVEVLDEGSGIDPKDLDRLFEPFFTTKPPGQGTGLGLPMVYNIVQEHGGTIVLENRDGGGVRAVMQLPAADGATADEPAEPGSGVAAV